MPHAIIGQMERAAGFVSDDTSQAKLDKLDAVLMQSYTAREDAALFAEMLLIVTNAVVIAESTRRLVGNLFELEDLGAQERAHDRTSRPSARVA